MSSVFRFAQSEGIACTNVADVVREAVELNFKHNNHPFIKDHKRMGKLLRDCELYNGDIRVRVALCLLPHVFVRPGELRYATWNEFDFDNALWKIPAERMKMKIEHVVPLSPQSIALIKQLEPLKSESMYLFQGQSPKEQPFSEVTLNHALRRMGYGKDEIVSHGFRGFASTNLNELGYDWHHIEVQMAHKVGSAVSQVYNKAAYLQPRRRMMNDWSEFLDDLKGRN
jgi:integrase